MATTVAAGGQRAEAHPSQPAPGQATGSAQPAGPARLLIGLVRLYQMARRGRPSPCRYLPSCSEYAAVALHRHGAARGSWLAVRRLCRCHPWGGFGADPVPDHPVARNS